MQSVDWWRELVDVELDEDEVRRVAAAAAGIAARYVGGDGEDDRAVALDAAIQRVIGETSLDEFGADLRDANRAQRRAQVAVEQAAAMAVEDGEPEDEIARQLGVGVGLVRAALRPRG